MNQAPERAEAMGLRAAWERYGSLGLLRLIRDTLLTRVLFPGCRIVRYPFYVRGRSAIRIGKGFTAGVGLRLDAFPRGAFLHDALSGRASPPDGSAKVAGVCLTIGERVEVNDYVHIGAIESVQIGNDVLIASKVFISDHDHGTYSGPGEHSSPESRPADRPCQSAPVVIEDRVWLGESVCVLPGVKIGAGSIVGAHSVVTRDIPANCIAVGSPARVVKRFCPVSKRWEPAKDAGSGA